MSNFGYNIRGVFAVSGVVDVSLLCFFGGVVIKNLCFSESDDLADVLASDLVVEVEGAEVCSGEFVPLDDVEAGQLHLDELRLGEVHEVSSVVGEVEGS